MMLIIDSKGQSPEYLPTHIGIVMHLEQTQGFCQTFSTSSELYLASQYLVKIMGSKCEFNICISLTDLLQQHRRSVIVSVAL